MYVDEKCEGFIGDELTKNADDIDYELWRISRNFLTIVVQSWNKQNRAERRKARREANKKK